MKDLFELRESIKRPRGINKFPIKTDGQRCEARNLDLQGYLLKPMVVELEVSDMVLVFLNECRPGCAIVPRSLRLSLSPLAEPRPLMAVNTLDDVGRKEGAPETTYLATAET